MRDCENCIHYKEGECSVWDCDFKLNTYEQGYKDGYEEALKEALERLKKVIGE